MAGDSANATFSLEGEDHTLGNSLRWVLNKNPHTALCGYSVPHPSEEVVNIRIQTTGELPAAQVFREGVADLMTICDHVQDTFTKSVEEFKKKNAGKNSDAMEVNSDSD
jgi:DNA-directed RNA polymerase I and III subunit RPAC2